MQRDAVGELLKNMGSSCRELVLSRYTHALSKIVDSVAEYELGIVAAKLYALSNPARLRILRLLCTVREGLPLCLIAAVLGKTMQFTSYHIKVLKECGLVEEVSHGSFKLYKVNREAVDQLLNELKRLVELEQVSQ